MIYYYTIFAVIVTIIITDQNVIDFVNILGKTLWVKIQSLFWRMMLHPVWFTNPISKRLWIRKYEKQFQDLKEKINVNEEV